MANHLLTDFDLEEAKLLSDLAGIRLDLDDAGQFALRLEQIFATMPIDNYLVDALTTAILVRYARAFSHGVRAKLNQEHVAQLTEHQQALHERFMDWRNKHIAHSVNPFEENQFVVQYVAETVHEIGIQAVSVRQDRLVGLSAEDLSDIQDLIQALLAIVDAEYETERARLLALVRRIPVAEVIAGAKGRSAPAGIESVKRVRSR